MVVVENLAPLKAADRDIVSQPLARRVLTLASGTMASRLTGFLRTLVAAFVLGFTPFADAFNLANTMPNSLYDFVIGGVISATFVSVFVHRLTLDGERKAWRSISTVITMTVTLLIAATVLVFAFAPFIVDAMTAMHHLDPHRTAEQLAQQRQATVAFLRWFAPQIFLYGVFALASVLLQVRGRFGVAGYAPVANNVVAIAVLWWFHLAVPHPTVGDTTSTSQFAWFAGITTLGLLAQFLVVVPSLFRTGLGRLRFRWDLRDDAVREIGRLGGWTLVVVAANQVSLYVVLAMAFGLGGDGPVTAYTYGWSFMQMPYAVIVLSVLSVLGPELVTLHASGERRAFSDRLQQALVTSLSLVVPLSVVLTVLAQPVTAVLLNHADARQPLSVGVTLAVLSAGLPGFTIYQVGIRGLQAQLRGAEVAMLSVGQNALALGLALTMGRHSLGALMGSISLSYAVAAVAVLVVLWQQGVDVGRGLLHPQVRMVFVVSLIGGLAAAVGYSVRGDTEGLGLVLRLILAGLAAITVVGVWFARHHRRQRVNRVKV